MTSTPTARGGVGSASESANPTQDTPDPVEVDWGTFRRLEPVSRVFGIDRGPCIDRYYIESFLQQHVADIRGHVLEVADDQYTRRFGGNDVQQNDILHIDPTNRRATMTADLTEGKTIASDTFDCVILTQTLQHIFDVHAVVRTLYRILQPGGVVLATVPGISQISRYDMDRWGDYWRFTTRSIERLFSGVFVDGGVFVESFGNVMVANAFLQGLSADELSPAELDRNDPDYQVVVTVRAQKGGAGRR